ncbi:hypothetical protein [Enterobacter ludwigii]|jgi:hypothetical protein|uniref:hypothetical protein n=1 Tax=Enterobacter ludwigii TaxID=299767 RepID=UPI00041F1EBE|nr:hypothetical protein [Enterobacter ludwigii]
MTILSKVLKWYALSVSTVFILGWLFVWLVVSGSDETTVYTENDFFHYHTLTDKDIENAPRIRDDYYFEAHPGDGYAPSNSIVFKGLPGLHRCARISKRWDTRKKSVARGEKATWSKPDQIKGDIFYLYFNAATGEVELTKVMNYSVN